WNSRDPERVSLAYSTDSQWRNREQGIHGREQIKAFLYRKWARECDPPVPNAGGSHQARGRCLQPHASHARRQEALRACARMEALITPRIRSAQVPRSALPVWIAGGSLVAYSALLCALSFELEAGALSRERA